MPLHRLTSITLGVPNVGATAGYYEDFGLTPVGEKAENRFATAEGGEQLKITHSPLRRLVELGVGVDDPDDLDRIEASLAKLDVAGKRDETSLRVLDPNSNTLVVLEIAPHLVQVPVEQVPYNGPGRVSRPDGRAPGVERTNKVRPKKLGHVVIGSKDQDASQKFFTEGIGFKASDHVPSLASFLRCSTDHHNLLIQKAPVDFLHHTAWEVDDVDEVGRGATEMLEGNPERHVWGLGRHHIGSNFFWYLKDPAGNFSEYYSDLDCIVDDALWKPSVVEGTRGVYNWGPPLPPSFLKPEDLAALMTGTHSPR
ncbi:VOC family protein [Amycolatopsis carbonis]|uniref:VOC family protein n=1 Tax=Amycolatopsis carbonis TaxID=715471 RepID=A0A9Y2ILC1_9PSEU|nr:VOC family protein [Amycolatopsis sp. 2-15]WIX82222.1 VOC family protein [Amycolatopsis sp. 2-15]